MQWLNANSGAVQAIAGVVIVLLTASLVGATVWYVRLTHKIARASIEQSEAQQKPCLILRATRRDDMDAILDPPMAAVVEDGTLRLMNIGNGPAIHVEFDFRRIQQNRLVSSRGMIPNLDRGAQWDTPLATGLLTAENPRLIVTYGSLSGTQYRTRITFDGRIIQSLQFGRATEISEA